MECSNNSIKIIEINQKKKGVTERKAKTPLIMDSPLPSPSHTTPKQNWGLGYILTVAGWGAPGPTAVEHP